jgi:multidrug efflux pump subunit AcrA (membrane-fusion protein)
MQAGPLQVDVDAKETVVAQASTTLTNFYASIPATVAEAYDESFSGVSGDTDTLFSQPDSASPTLLFSTINSQLAVNAVNDRTQVNGELGTLGTQANALSETSSTGDIDAALASSLLYLQVLRTYSDDLLSALGDATPSGTFPASSVAAAQTSVATLRNTVNGLIVTLQGEQQQISTDELAVQSAQDALNQTLAGSTPQDIEAQQAQVAAAQANVENYDAQIANGTVVAPFAGTVASVEVQVGDIVAPNTVAIALNPNSALQVVAYFSEIDVTQIKTGAQASVTLDAYGDSRVFPAQVVSVDSSPSQDPSQPTGVLGYKVTLQFTAANPAITSGMTANVTIPTQ